jgi:hypothetical protein
MRIMIQVGIRFYTANKLDNNLFDLILFSERMVYVNMSTNCFACYTNTSFKVQGDGFRVAVVHELTDEREAA